MRSLRPYLDEIQKRVRVKDRMARLAHEHEGSVVGHLTGRALGLPERPVLMYWFSKRRNFGDAVSPVVVQKMANGTPVHVTSRYRGKLLAIGSVLFALAEGDRVWGAGTLWNRRIRPPRDVTFHAVRGPLTRGLLDADVPEIYGDPAMLLPTIYQPQPETHFELGLVPHHRDTGARNVADPSIAVIDVSGDWREVVERIAACEVVLSSSLHGLIVAEAYGIPGIWVRPSGKVPGDEGFKFRDYYLGTGREPPTPLDWDRALTSWDKYVTPPPILDVDPLLRAWPTDLTFAREPA